MLKDNLKKYREMKGLTISKLAELTNMSDRIISLIENGKSHNPCLSTLLSLSNVLEVPIEDLIK